MKSRRLSYILAGAIFLFLCIMHMKPAADAWQRKYSLHSFQSMPIGRAEVKEKKSPPSDRTKISINNASFEDISRVNGFGPSLTEKIITRRKKEKGKLTEEDILSINGIGEARLATLKEHFIIPSRMPAAVARLSFSDGTCPFCHKILSDHHRKKKQQYIYCPHCLKYLEEEK